MNRISNELALDFWMNFHHSEHVHMSEIEELEKRVGKAIIEFRRKCDKSDYTTDKAFLDGSILVLQWMQEELKKIKRR